MSDTVSDFVIDRLIEWDLHQFYGFPGDGIGGFDGALERGERDDKAFRYIRPTHEEIAAFMACAHAKFTGDVGVCIATSGPGAIHLLNGLYDAKMDNQPVVAIVGQQGRAAFGSDTQQQVDLERVYQDVAGYVQTVVTPMQAQLVVDRAVRIAAAERCPTVVILPADVQNLPMEEPAMEHWVARTGVGYASTVLTPEHEELQRAADVLNAGSKVAMIVGQGARGATDEVIAIAEQLGAGVITALLGKDVIPGDLPYHTQQLGLLGSKPSYDMMQDCDTLLMIGSNYPYAEFLPETGQARGVQIDLAAGHLSLRYPMEVNLAGDAKATMTALLPLLHRQEDRSWQEKVVGGMQDWEQVLTEEAGTEADPINPRSVYHELNKRLPSDVIVTADAGSTADWYGHHIKLGRKASGNLSGMLASMLAAMPYAVSAKFAHPDRPVVCTIGDGAFQMLGMNELITVKRHWKSWENPQFIVLVSNNGDLNQVSWEMREAGDPRYDTSQLVERIDYAGYAKLLGLEGITVERPEDVAGAWDAAFAADRPVVLDVHTDPNVPPLPAHISLQEAKGFLAAMRKGDPAEASVIRDSMKAMGAELKAGVKNALGRDDG
ncbi:thiamine pyrophosphate-requiring protein [Flexivirga endophytica]|uniref:Thiamine pyrophosphate-requiring protein n=1 Tax=Flexivirga endophytica TaxID=1849103 RepID=A0A916TAH4_9MICO|nr:thiamine pyrophosphate-requiring protein [Flexivirga endophytica]GGB35201.1 thiamine pyrophosphate-requiring protein [Flexivirga endophytica]GHB43018.1 thiamine pyrophosphate-requiring protein [Flexivirga endophytica]